MLFDPANNIVRLCARGMDLEGNPEAAYPLFLQAWREASDDMERFVAAHYMARQQKSVAEKLKWDERALHYALKEGGEHMRAGLPSLYLNIARCHEDLEAYADAGKYYKLAWSAADDLPDDGYGRMIRSGIRNGMKRIE